MITLRELRTISLEFRRVSSNFLNCDDDTADVALIRFYSYLIKTETILDKGIMPSEKVLDFPVDCNTLTGSVNL